MTYKLLIVVVTKLSFLYLMQMSADTKLPSSQVTKSSHQNVSAESQAIKSLEDIIELDTGRVLEYCYHARNIRLITLN